LAEIRPPEGAKVNFTAATVFARKIDVAKRQVMLTGGHKGNKASLDIGWLIIDRQWYPASTS
jgi:uncharacterized protein YggU (UPF0235/DUF167 family)